MGTIQPQSDPTIPANLKKQIDAVKDSITIGDAEIKRLGGLINSQKYEISQFNNKEKELIKNIKDLETRSQDAVELLRGLNVDIKKETKIKNNLEKNNKDNKIEQDKALVDISAREDVIKNKEKELSEREEKLHQSEVDLAIAETRFDEKKTRLETAIKAS